MRAILTIVLLALALPAAAPGGGARSDGCTPGVKKLDGKTVRVFCGPARARVRIGGSTVVFRNGECAAGGGGFAVNIGTWGTTKRPYFGVFVERAKPGTYENQAITYTHAGRSQAVIDSTLVVAKGLKSGTFKGTLLGSNRPVSGSFSC